MHLTPFATSRRDPWCRAKSGCGLIVRRLDSVVLLGWRWCPLLTAISCVPPLTTGGEKREEWGTVTPVVAVGAGLGGRANSGPCLLRAVSRSRLVQRGEGRRQSVWQESVTP